MAKEIKAGRTYNYEDSLLFPRLDTFCGNNQERIFYISFTLLILFGFLLFDIRISPGGDDSEYLVNAKKFLDGKEYPIFHGALYTIFLSFIMKVFGFHLVLFKAFSLLFLLISHFLFYRMLRDRISPFILSSILILTALNGTILFFGSHTYSEAFYMMLQSLFLYLIIGIIPYLSKETLNNKRKVLFYFFFGMLAFALTSTRNVGMAGLITAIAFFTIKREWLLGIGSLIAFMVFRLPYFFYKKFAWGISKSDLNGQLAVMLQKDPYNASHGSEHIAGMFERFFENFRIYLGEIFPDVMGLWGSQKTLPGYLIAILIAAILISGFIHAVKHRNDILIVIFLYLGISLAIVFFSLSPIWSQSRLIIVYLPLLLLCTLWSLASLGRFFKMNGLLISTAIIICLALFQSFSFSMKKASVNREVVKRVSQGDRYYGLSPDIANFQRASAWAAANINDSIQIASRKPSMSFIYGGGRIFYPLYKLPYINTDTLLKTISTEENPAIIINEDEINLLPVTSKEVLRPYLYAFISAGKAVYHLHLGNNNEIQKIDSLLKDENLTSYHSINKFRQEVLRPSVTTSALVPEEMLRELITGDVGYLISASLRINRLEQTEQTINTVQRYMGVIDRKYPGVFKRVKTFGKPEEEPATIYSLDLKRFKQ
jgi:hypothetical protein